MQKLVRAFMLGVGLGACTLSIAQEVERKLCDPADPKNNCPGAKCVCTEDTLEVTFAGDNTNSIFQYDNFVADTAVDTVVISDTKADKVQGWSFGVDHDDAFLTLVSATIDGTDAELAKTSGGFFTTNINVETCANNADPKKCPNPEPGSGYITAVIISLTQPIFLKVQRNSLINAKYTLKADAGTAGTTIIFSDKLKVPNSPPADINITEDGNSKLPTTVIDGLVKKAGPAVEICNNGTDDDGDGKVDCADEDCAGDPACPTTETNCTDGIDNDNDGKIDCTDEDCATNPACVATPETNCTDGIDNDNDGATDCADSDCATDPACAAACEDYAFYFGPAASSADVALGAATSHVITMRNVAASLGFQLGVKATAGATTGWQFSGALASDDQHPVIDLLITDDQGNPHTPKAGNKATSATGTVSKIDLGAALVGFDARDFFSTDLNPGVGGPGYIVGYVSDTNPPAGGGNKIPATGAGTPCPVNEILKVTLGGAPTPNFSRGDADGNGKLNVVDGILIIQIAVGNIAEKFDCDKVLDANDDGKVEAVADSIAVLSYVFQRGAPLPAPFRACAADPTADTLTCTASNCQ